MIGAKPGLSYMSQHSSGGLSYMSQDYDTGLSYMSQGAVVVCRSTISGKRRYRRANSRKIGPV